MTDLEHGQREKTKEAIKAMCQTIDRCGENIPLTSWLLSMSANIDVDTAESLLQQIEDRTSKIMRFSFDGRNIWVRPNQVDVWQRRQKKNQRRFTTGLF